MKWENVSVFISSTFNDMHAERDYLVKTVFPELSEWCEKRKLRLVDIDLRWGVTSADSEAQNTVLTCLKNIDGSRPFFLCFLGQRRGWVPKQNEISESTLKNYPGVRPHIGTSSVTEMEIEHALLAPMLRMVNGATERPAPVKRALFFFRKDQFTDDLTKEQKRIYTNAAEEDAKAADEELEAFKKKVYANGSCVTTYDCRWDKEIITPELLTEGTAAAQGRLTDFSVDGRPLKDAIIEKLKTAIAAEFPEREELTAQTVLENDLDQQAQFIAQNQEGFIPRSGDFDQMDGYIAGTERGMLVLTAQAGLGKTMLLCNYAQKLQDSGQRVYARFCGASDLASEQYSLWKSIFDEAGAECPPSLDELYQNMDNALLNLSQKGSAVMIIDALNQLDGGLSMLDRLPRSLPDGIKLIVSFKEDEDAESLIEVLKRNGTQLISVHPFSAADDKRALIDAYLEKYLKSLDEAYIKLICSLPGSNNPLYLKILLSELRMFGAFKQLEDEIKRYGETPLSAFDRVLERLETDPAYCAIAPGKAVPFLFGLLSRARKGLSEEELVFCFKKEFTNISDEDIKSMIRLYIRQLRPFLARREGRTDYLYESFMLAARRRYAAAGQYDETLLAECFRSYADPNGDFPFAGGSKRALAELPYHMYRAGENGLLEKMLCDYSWLYHKLRLCGADAVTDDFTFVGGVKASYYLRLIKDSLMLSAHILRNDHRQLPSQLWGRLADTQAGEIRRLLTAAQEQTNEPWLRPIHTCLNAPGGALLGTLAGHTGRITDMAVYGALLITAAWDKTIRIWDSETLLYKRVLTGHKETIDLLAIHNDLLFSFSEKEKLIKIWDMLTFSWIKDIDIAPYWTDARMSGSFMGIYENMVYLRIKDKILYIDASELAVSHTIPWYEDEGAGHHLAAVVLDGRIYSCWQKILTYAPRCTGVVINDAATGGKTGSLEAGTGDFQHICDVGSGLVAVSCNNEIQLWDTKSGECLWRKNGIAIKRSVRWKDKLVVCSLGYQVYDLKTGNIIKKFLHPGETRSLNTGMAVIGDRLFTIHADERVRVWDLNGDYSAVNLGNVFGERKIIGCNQELLITAHLRTISAFDIISGEHVMTLDGHTAAPITAVFDGSRMITGTAKGEIKVWDLSTKTCLLTMQGPADQMAGLLLYGDCIMAVPYHLTSDTVMFFDKNTGECVRELPGVQCEKSLLYQNTLLLYTHSGKNNLDKKIEAYDSDTGERLYTLTIPILRAWMIVGDVLVTIPVSLRYSIERYNATTGQKLGEIPLASLLPGEDLSDTYVDGAAVYQDKLVLTVQKKNRSCFTCVIDIYDGTERCRFASHADAAYLLQIKNSIIHTASEDKTIKLWDMSGQQLTAFCSDFDLQQLLVFKEKNTIVAQTKSDIMQWLVLEPKKTDRRYDDE